MKDCYGVMLKSSLFQSICKEELQGILSCLNAQISNYEKDEMVFIAGAPASCVGLILYGGVQVERNDVLGNRTILAKLLPGDLFGETFACAGIETLPVSVTATTASQILLLDYRRIITTCSSSCSFHSRLIENMLRILAGKNLRLNDKIEVLSAKGLREKLLTFLHSQARTTGAAFFVIPFDRQELADYLAVDRSALSRELGAMQRDGLIRVDRNRFEIL